MKKYDDIKYLAIPINKHNYRKTLDKLFLLGYELHYSIKDDLHLKNQVLNNTREYDKYLYLELHGYRCDKIQICVGKYDNDTDVIVNINNIKPYKKESKIYYKNLIIECLDIENLGL